MSACDRFLIPTYPSLSGTSPLFISKLRASVPLSIISIFVMQPIVRYPFTSIFLAKWSTSSLVISWFAGITHRIIVLGYYMYFFIILVVTYSMFSSCPSIAIRVRPGKSIIVRLGQLEEYTSKMIGLSIMFLRFPHTFSVKSYMLYLTLVKLVIFSGSYANCA